MGIVGRAAAAYAGARYFTLIDGIVLPRWFLAPLRDALSGAGCEVSYIVLRASLETCAARLRKREEQPLANPAAIGSLHAQFADLGEFEPNALDVEGMEPEQVVAAVEGLLEDRTHLL